MNLLKKTLLTALACFIMIMALVFVVTGSGAYLALAGSGLLALGGCWVVGEIVRWWADVREGDK